MTVYYTSNDASAGFDATTVGNQATSFVNIIGTWLVGTTLPTSPHTHTYGSTSKADGDIALATGVAAVADMEVLYAQKLATGWVQGTTHPTIGPVLRSNSAGTAHYAVVVSHSGSALVGYIFVKNGGGYSVAVGPTTISKTFAAGDVMWLRAQASGTTIRFRIWKDGTSEPGTWDVSVTNATVSAAGYAGFYYALDGLANGTVAMGLDEFQILSIAGEVLTVSTPGPQIVGAAMTVSGIYTNGPPASLEYRIDAGIWTAASSPTIAGGSYSFSITAPSAGTHTVSVRDPVDTSTAVTSGSFTTSTGRSIAVTTPSGWIAGATVTLSGTYGGTAPAGLNFKIDAGSYGAASSPTITGGNWSFSLTAPATGSHTITVQESDSTGTTAATSSFSVLQAIAGDNAAIAFSPYTWNVGTGKAITANAGAYFRTLFTGTSCILNFDVSAMVSPASQVWWRIDNGPWTQAAVASSLTLTVPAITAGNADVPYHLLEVVVKSMTETGNRWNTGNSTRVIFTGLTLDASAAVLVPRAAPLNLLVLGDSITEGVRTLGEAAANDTDRNDAMMGWAHRLGALLGAEVGVVGFGASGLSVTGSGNVPILGTSYASLYSGVSRSFSPTPDLVVINIGTNDGATNTVTAMTGLLNALIAACPGKPIAVLRPFNGNQAGNLQSAIAACNAPASCAYVNTTGFFNTSYGADALNLHPSGPNNLTQIAPQIAAQLRTLVAGSTAKTFRGGYQRGLLG